MSRYLFHIPQKQVNSKWGFQSIMSTSSDSLFTSESTSSGDKTNAQQTNLRQQKETRDNLLEQLCELQKKLKELEERDYHPQL